MKDTLLNKYFVRPIFWDYTIGLVLVGALYYSTSKGFVQQPKKDFLLSMLSDISNIGFTVTSLLLTILTILITFKSSSTSSKKRKRLFDLFFSSKLYHETASHFKNSLFSLLILSTMGYMIKFLLHEKHLTAIYLFSFFAITILIMTILRSAIQLTLVMKLQKESDQSEKLKD